MVDEYRKERLIGVGCFTAIAGFFSGGMVGVLVAKGVGFAQKCSPPEGLPACNWYIYAAAGMLLGVVTLPALALWRLRGKKEQ
jgi:hypothetical protein